MGFHVSIPYFQSLARPDGWSRTQGTDRGFHVIRLHYFFRPRKNLGRLFTGEPLANLEIPAGTVREDHEVLSGEIERTDVQASCEALVVELECASKLVSEIGAAAKMPGSGTSIDSKLLAETCASFRKEARVEKSRVETVRKKETWTISQKLTIDGSVSSGPLYVQSLYRQRGYDIYLTFVDYLFVDYERRRAWQRRRRTKFPPLPDLASSDWWKRANATRTLNVPVKTVKFWEVVEHRQSVVAGEYEPDVGDPFEILEEELLGEGPTYSFGRQAGLKSLYSYANYAFPPKWSKAVMPVIDA